MPEFKEPFYLVHSGGRDQDTRTRRGRSAGHRFVQKLAGGTVNVRHKRPATVTKDQLELHLAEFVREWRLGHLEVRTVLGDLVDLVSGVQTPVEEVEAPRPNFRPDSAANDKTFPAGIGNPMPQFQDGLGEGETGTVPELLEDLKLDAEVPLETSGDPALARKEKREDKKDKKK